MTGDSGKAERPMSDGKTWPQTCDYLHRKQEPKPNGLGSSDDRGSTISRILQLPAIALAADAAHPASSASCARLLRTSFIHGECTSSHL